MHNLIHRTTEILQKLVLLFSLSMVTVAWANGDHASTIHTTTSLTQSLYGLPQPQGWHPAPPPQLVATVYPGSIKANVTSIATRFGWDQVIWRAPYDYNWVGKTQLHAVSIDGLLEQLLHGYPLQAVFYQGNHILVIHPRVLK